MRTTETDLAAEMCDILKENGYLVVGEIIVGGVGATYYVLRNGEKFAVEVSKVEM